jgi:hypothetical protein
MSVYVFSFNEDGEARKAFSGGYDPNSCSGLS